MNGWKETNLQKHFYTGFPSLRGRIDSVRNVTLIAANLRQLDILRRVDFPRTVFCSDSFKKGFSKLGFTGCSFYPVKTIQLITHISLRAVSPISTQPVGSAAICVPCASPSPQVAGILGKKSDLSLIPVVTLSTQHRHFWQIAMTVPFSALLGTAYALSKLDALSS